MNQLKRKWFPLTLVFLFIFTLSSCNEECPPCDKDPKPVAAPNQVIEVDQAKMAYDAYGKRRVPLIQRYEDSINRSRGYDKKQQMQEDKNGEESANASSKPFDVARYVHYDYATIKQYLAYIEQEAKAANVEISTLRFYLSNYPDQTFFPGTKDSIMHPRQNSVLISPTIKKGKRDFLFYIDDSIEEQPKAVILNDGFGPAPKGFGDNASENNRSYASFLPSLTEPNTKTPILYQGRSVTLNKGGGAPPPYPEQ